MISFHSYFDKKFDIKDWKSWVSMIPDLGIHGMNMEQAIGVCIKQLRLANADPDQNLLTPSEILGINESFLSKDTEASPQVGKWSGKESIFWILSLALGAVSWYGEFESEFYFYELGYGLSGFISTLFVALDTWCNWGLIHSEKPWITLHKEAHIAEV